MSSEGTAREFSAANMVEKQLVAAANGGLDQQRAFEKFILDETLFAATPDVHPEGIQTLKADTRIPLLNIALADGREATAVFTAPQRIWEVFGEVGYLGIQGRALFEMIRARPAVLNPGLPYGVVWEPESMAAMLGFPAERVVQKGTQIMLGSPANPPPQLIERLTSAFAKIPQIDAAWLALAAWPETSEQSWYIDVRTSASEHEEIRLALPRAIDGVDLLGKPLDMVINPTGAKDGVGIVIVQNHQSVPKKSFLRRLFK